MNEKIAEIMLNPWGPALIILAFEIGLMAGLIISNFV